MLKQFGELLVRDGWDITPVAPREKKPIVPEWQRLPCATVSDVQKWVARYGAQCSIGIRTANTPAVDLDVRCAQAVEYLVEAVQDLVGNTLVRTGEPPKALLVYRTTQPFGKLKSATYIDPDEFGLEHHVEILGRGQQFVAMGIHPVTKQPYAWSEPLTDYTHASLPELTLDHARQIIALFDDYAMGRGWQKIAAGNDRDQDMLDEETLAFYAIEPPLENVDVPHELKSLKHHAKTRDGWMRVGFAIHRQYLGSEEGFDVFHDWSEQCENYTGWADCRELWRTTPEQVKGKEHLRKRPVTWRTYHKEYLALQKKLSIVEKADQLKAEDETVKRATINGTHTHNGDSPPPDAPDPRSALAGAIDRYVYVVQGDLVHDLHRPAQEADMPMKAFMNLMKNQHYAAVDDKGEAEAKSLAHAWMAHPMRKTAERSVYHPGQGRLLRRGQWNYINSFALPRHERDEGWTLDHEELKVFVEHMDYLIPKEEERIWFIDWLAFTVARPEQRSKVTPLHISQPHGTGRGWVLQLLSAMLGDWNVKKTSMAVFSGEGGAGQFQDYLHRSLVVGIEEVRDGGRRFGVDDRVRDRLEAPRLEVNIKYGGKATIDVYCNFFLMSNHIDALVISDDDRRIQVLTGPNYPESLQYFNRLYRWLDGPGPGQLYHVLCRRNLAAFNWQRSSHFEGRQRMIQASMTDTELAFKAWVLKQDCDRQFKLAELEVELENVFHCPDVNTKMLGHLVREAAIRTEKGGVWQLRMRRLD